MLLVLLALTAQPLPDSDSVRPDTTSSDIIYYGGKRVVFYARSEEVVLLDSAWVRYRDMKVRSDSIHYDIRRRELGAHRQVVFYTSSESITGTLMRYNVDTRRGMMRLARTQVENGFFFATEAWLVRERVLNARRGSYTTCDRQRPHYDFYGPRVKLLMDDIAVTEPVFFRLGPVPVLAAPFWFVPVADKRKSGLMAFKVGQAQDQGWYAKNIAYYWAVNDYSDATFYLDVMTRKGIQFRGEGIYIVDPFARGSLQGSYIREWDTQRTRYAFNADHSSKFFLGTELTAQADLLSDRTYAPDYGEEPPDWLKQDLFSYASLARKFKGVGRLSLRADSRSDLVRHSRRMNLPTASFGFSPLRLPGGWDVAPGVSAGRVLSYTDSAGTDTARDERRTGSVRLGLSSPEYRLGRMQLDEDFSMSDVARRNRSGALPGSNGAGNAISASNAQRAVFGFLNLSEAASMTHEYATGDSNGPRVSYAASVTAGFPLYRVFSVEALNMHGLLHTVTPSLSAAYQPTVEPTGLFGRVRFTDPASAGLNLGLANSFQAKVGPGKLKLDIGSVDFATGYSLKTGRLTPLRAVARLRPFVVLPRRDTGLSRTSADLTIDAQAGLGLDTLRLSEDYSVVTHLTWGLTRTDTLRRDRGVELSINHTFGNSVNMLTGAVSLAVPGWRFSLTSLGYNIATRELANYGISVWKDLHCWEALANVTLLGSFRYDFEVRIKKLPDVKFGRSTFRPFLP